MGGIDCNPQQVCRRTWSEWCSGFTWGKGHCLEGFDRQEVFCGLCGDHIAPFQYIKVAYGKDKARLLPGPIVVGERVAVDFDRMPGRG